MKLIRRLQSLLYVIAAWICFGIFIVFSFALGGCI
jgi:hypothetical protein